MMGKSCVVISPYRSGNHLVMQLLKMLGLTEYSCWEGKRYNFLNLPLNGSYAFGDHIVLNKDYTNQINKRKAIFITRDPRDMVVSLYYFAKKDIPSWNFNQLSKSDCISLIIKGFSINPEKPPFKGRHPDIDRVFRSRFPWREVKTAYSTTFEKFIRSEKSREQEIKNIAEHLEMPLTKELLTYCVDTLIGYTNYPYNFRKGIIGDWKNHFTEEHKELFKKIAGQLLIEEGYEKDLKW